MSSIRRRKYEDPPGIAILGGFQSLFRGALAREGMKNQIQGDIYEGALKEGKEIGHKWGFQEGQMHGLKNFAINGGRYIATTNEGDFYSFNTKEELLENQLFRTVVSERAVRDMDNIPSVRKLRSDFDEIEKNIAKTTRNLRAQEPSFKSALEHIRDKFQTSAQLKGTAGENKNKYLAGVLERNQGFDTLEQKQQLFNDVRKYQLSYKPDWKYKGTDIGNMKAYFENYHDLGSFSKQLSEKQSELQSELEEIDLLKERRRNNIISSANETSNALRSLGVNFNTDPLFLTDSMNVYHIPNIREKSKWWTPSKTDFQDWRSNKSENFTSIEDLLYVPQHASRKKEFDSMTTPDSSRLELQPYRPTLRDATYDKIDQMIESSARKFSATLYRTTLRDEITHNQQTIPKLILDDTIAEIPETPSKSIKVVRRPNKTKSGKK